MDDKVSHIPDHQYESRVDEELERKEMDVFDYIGIEIRNIEEREKVELEKLEVVQEEMIGEEMVIEEEEEFYVERE
jgi:hypothetical protein